MNLSMPTERELERFQKALEEYDISRLVIKVDAGSPWILINAWVHIDGMVDLAIWRETGALYKVDQTGAVEDDPMVQGWKLIE